MRDASFLIVMESKRVFGADLFLQFATVAQINRGRGPGRREGAFVLDGEMDLQVLVLIVGADGSSGAPILLCASCQPVFHGFAVKQLRCAKTAVGLASQPRMATTKSREPPPPAMQTKTNRSAYFRACRRHQAAIFSWEQRLRNVTVFWQLSVRTISLTVRQHTAFAAYKKGMARKSLGEQNCSLRTGGRDAANEESRWWGTAGLGPTRNRPGGPAGPVIGVKRPSLRPARNGAIDPSRPSPVRRKNRDLYVILCTPWLLSPDHNPSP
jgi:hypothetical protein